MGLDSGERRCAVETANAFHHDTHGPLDEHRRSKRQTDPLSLEDIIKTLSVQADACRGAFARFQDLVREHEAAITPDNAKALAELA